MINHFKKTIRFYYRDYVRKLPWRETKNPYHIFISEVMLQQTQVTRVLKKYPEFLKTFPTFQSLAEAPLRTILKEWQGMGYNRRGKYLKEAAQIIVKEYRGTIPRDTRKVDALPGVGYATASSILCFAYNIPTVFIETNIRRVYIHFFFRDRDDVDDKEIYLLVEKTLDRKNPREWYYALMDYGAMLGKQKENPNKRSRHYSIQSTFEGSDRKVRGEILKIMLKEEKISKKNLFANLAIEKTRFDTIISQLEKEKLIGKRGSYYFVE